MLIKMLGFESIFVVVRCLKCLRFYSCNGWYMDI